MSPGVDPVLENGSGFLRRAGLVGVVLFSIWGSVLKCYRGRRWKFNRCLISGSRRRGERGKGKGWG